MNEHGKSDRFVVPENSPNVSTEPTAEAREGREQTKGNTRERNALERVVRPQRETGNSGSPVADQRIVRLIQKWLNAGVLEEGHRIVSEVGTVQGGSISPLLANVYPHYVFALWAQRWRQRHAHGDVVVVRFADDFVMGFEHRDDAEHVSLSCANAARGLD